MARTLLQLIQAASNELGIPEPSAIVGAQDDQSKQLLALANREGKDFSILANGKGGWQELHKEYTFQTVAIPVTTGNVTEGSAIITNIPDTTGIVADTWAVTGNGIIGSARVISVDSSTQVTISLPCNATVTGSSLTFGQVAYSLPSDFEYFVQRTFWDGAYRWELLGPITAQEKQVLRYGVIASGPRRKFYVRNSKIWLDPIPSDGQTIAYDYFSNAWCRSASGTAQSAWNADLDLYNLDEDCFIQGLKWRFLRSKGLDYAQEKADYDNDCQRVMSRDGGARDLSLTNPAFEMRLINNENIPETGFGV